MTKKHKFSSPERFALWQIHKFQCFWCGEPLRIVDCTVDHVIPESLLEKPDALQRRHDYYSLPEGFEINNFCNWVPCHAKCNSKKKETLHKASPAMIAILHELDKKAIEAQKI